MRIDVRIEVNVLCVRKALVCSSNGCRGVTLPVLIENVAMRFSRRRSASLLVALVAIHLTACATVLRKEHDTIIVDSDPQGAKIKVDSIPIGKTPMQARVERDGSSIVTVSKKGFKDRHIVTESSLSTGWLIWDAVSCIWALCIPLVVDAVSGAWYDVDPDRSFAELEK